jgi:predicted dinucleotide-binding enzyme
VGTTLAAGFLEHGHPVTVGTRDASRLSGWAAKHPGVRVASFSDAARFGDVVVLAVKGTAASDVLRAAGAASLSGKTVIDVTNPIADTPPRNGVLAFFTSFEESLMERLQREYPGAHFVKAFSCVGQALMVNPKLAGGPPTMFICGNDDAARETVRGILDQFGWETEDLGKAEAARAIEPLCILWCIPGFLANDWAHALKMLR